MCSLDAPVSSRLEVLMRVRAYRYPQGDGQYFYSFAPAREWAEPGDGFVDQEEEIVVEVLDRARFGDGFVSATMMLYIPGLRYEMSLMHALADGYAKLIEE